MWSVKDFTYARTFINANIVSEKIQCFLTIMFLLIYPLVVSLFKHYGMAMHKPKPCSTLFFWLFLFLLLLPDFVHVLTKHCTHCVFVQAQQQITHVHCTSLTKWLLYLPLLQYEFLGILIVKFAQIKTHLQIQCNIGKVMLIKIIVVIDILSS